MTSSLRDLVGVLRTLHDRTSRVVEGLSPAQLRAQSFDDGWSVADVLSHLATGAEIGLLRLAASGDGPAPEATAEIWARWADYTPEKKAREYVVTGDRFVSTLEKIDEAVIEAMHVDVLGHDLDAPDVLRLRIAEQAVHGWDVEVAFDPGAVLARESIPVLFDLLPVTLHLATRRHSEEMRLAVTTTSPTGELVLHLHGGLAHVREPEGDADEVDGTLRMPAEAFLRMVYGRLDTAHTPPYTATGTADLDRLRAVFPGF